MGTSQKSRLIRRRPLEAATALHAAVQASTIVAAAYGGRGRGSELNMSDRLSFLPSAAMANGTSSVARGDLFLRRESLLKARHATEMSEPAQTH